MLETCRQLYPRAVLTLVHLDAQPEPNPASQNIVVCFGSGLATVGSAGILVQPVSVPLFGRNSRL